MGLGLGGNMQPMITAVQNAVSPREIGVATSSVAFFRSMGGTLGTAIFLSVLFNVLPGKISSAFATARTTPEFQAALAANPDQAETLQQAPPAAATSATPPSSTSSPTWSPTRSRSASPTASRWSSCSPSPSW